jgi:MscS family membrane protein
LLETFLDSVDRTWALYSADDPGFEAPWRVARESLDMSEFPPLVAKDVSAQAVLRLKEVLDRIELPPSDQIPDASMVKAQKLDRWTLPHTEIQMVRIKDGEQQGQWVFSAGTVTRAEEFYDRVKHLPYKPGRTGGHIDELRTGSKAIFLIKLRKVMPPWFESEVRGMRVWQWFGLSLLVLLLTGVVLALVWLGRRLERTGSSGRRLGAFLPPLALMSVPWVGELVIDRLFELPGAPAVTVELGFSIAGDFGLAWIVALVLTGIGDVVIRLVYRDARPLKKQLVGFLFRIATIVVVTAIAIVALQRLGVPVAGLIAGVGVGGLAIALAAQDTLENFIGGMILYTDQPVRVGDFCRFGDRQGTVEDVGLRSVKLRTLERTVVTVPNADFVKMQLENLTKRDRILLQEDLCLRYETTNEQLLSVLAELEGMLKSHPQIADDPIRVRFMGLGRYYFEIEIFAYGLTRDWAEFLLIRQDVFTKVLAIIERSGARLALPTEIVYAAREETTPT